MFGRKSQGSEQSPAWFRCESCEEITQLRGREALLRVCASCGHHGYLSARQRIELLCDPGSFEQRFSQLRASDPFGFRGEVRYRDELKAARKGSGASESVMVGEARLGGGRVVVVASEVGFLQGKIGAASGETIARAFELALEKKSPILLALSSGGLRQQEGPYAAATLPRIVTTLVALRRSGITSVVIASGRVEGAGAVLASLADFCWCEPGTRVAWKLLSAGSGPEQQKGGRPTVESFLPRSRQREHLVALVSALGRS